MELDVGWEQLIECWSRFVGVEPLTESFLAKRRFGAVVVVVPLRVYLPRVGCAVPYGLFVGTGVVDEVAIGLRFGRVILGVVFGVPGEVDGTSVGVDLSLVRGGLDPDGIEFSAGWPVDGVERHLDEFRRAVKQGSLAVCY